jgi:hypothetical protein
MEVLEKVLSETQDWYWGLGGVTRVLHSLAAVFYLVALILFPMIYLCRGILIFSPMRSLQSLNSAFSQILRGKYAASF